MLTAWRLVHKRKVDEAFTGTGSRRYGGRWNYSRSPVNKAKRNK